MRHLFFLFFGVIALLGFTLNCGNSSGNGNNNPSGHESNAIITEIASGGFFPCWSNDGNFVIFSSRQPCMGSTEDHDIMIVPAAGGTAQSVASTSDGTTSGYIYPSVSPTEPVAVFSRSFIASPIGGIQGADLYKVNLDGTSLSRVTTGNQYPSWPSYSPDGSRIAYICSHDIYILPTNSGASRFTLTSFNETGPLIWSPNGAKLIFLSNSSGTYLQYIMPVVVGASAERININGMVADWERSGAHRWLVIRAGDGIYAMNEDGTGEVRLIQDATVTNSTQAKWSPDGKKITYGGPCAIKVATNF